MKTILVLTDFSNSARNAAETAVLIAESLNTDILLLNNHSSTSLATQDVKPVSDSKSFQSSNNADMQKEAVRIEKIISKRKESNRKHIVNCINTEGLLSASVAMVLKKHPIIMIIMGGRITTNCKSFFGSDIYAVVNKANCPILILPDHKFDLKIKNLVFVTDLPTKDIKDVKYLVKLSGVFKFNIHLCHISDQVLIMDLIEAEDLSGFTSAVAKLNLRSISFRNLKGSNYVKEVEKFTKSVRADIVAMVHKKHFLFWRLFNDDHSKKLTTNQNTPYLILPEQWGKWDNPKEGTYCPI